MNNTAVVLCTYHRTFEGDGNKNILKFKDQNFDNFEILFDNQLGLTNQEISDKYNQTKICLFDDVFFKKWKYDRPIDTHHFWGSHQNPKYFYAHFRMLTYYIQNLHYDYYWFFDDDVSFEGDLKGLLSNYDEVNDDFIGIEVFKKEEYSEYSHISTVNSNMKGSKGYWFDHFPGPGDKIESDKYFGSFFPIVRLSRVALQGLWGDNEYGIYGYSEGFVPTAIVQRGGKISSMMDEHNNFNIENNKCTLFHKGEKFTWGWL